MIVWGTRRTPLEVPGYVSSVVTLQLDRVVHAGRHRPIAATPRELISQQLTRNPSYLQVARCIKTTYGSFVFKIQGLAPWWNGTTVPNSDVYLSVGGCIALGMEAISKCDYGGYFTSLVVGPTADGTSQISANVGVEPALNDLCRHG